MIKALVLKELRELRPIVAAALLGYCAIVGQAMGAKVFGVLLRTGEGRVDAPFVGQSFIGFFTIVSVLFVLVLGLRQSAWELVQGTYLFLLHRPISREALFLTKLSTGALVFICCAALPILVYGLWAAVPGHHPSPFTCSMTLRAWHVVFLLVPLYLGAFLSGLYPARWYGTRVLPLVAAVVFLGLTAISDRFWYLTFPALLGVDGVLVALILYVARTRDYS